MTLVLSEVSKHGIAMAADSAITQISDPRLKLPSGDSVPKTVRTGAEKIVEIKSIQAALSVWGFGAVGMPGDTKWQIPVDKFLLDFASTVGADETLEDVGNRLADEVNPRIRVGAVHGGFHLAGYVEQERQAFPVLYHVNTGPDDKHPKPLELYRDYPFDSGRTIQQWRAELEAGVSFWLRNGMIQTYVYFAESLNDLMKLLNKKFEFICPHHEGQQFHSPLEARARYLKLQIQTICEFYRLSNSTAFIAMPVSWITISPNGIQNFEKIVI